MKKFFVTLIILAFIGLFGFFFIAAKITDGENNVLERHEYGDIPSSVALIHDQLLIADLHADNLLWDRDILKELSHGHVDVPRLLKGNVALQVFDVVTKTPKGQNYEANSGDTDQITLLTMANRWPSKTWRSLYERAMYQAGKLHRASKRSNGTLKVIQSSEGLKSFLTNRANDKNMVGGILAIEGLHALEGRIEHLDSFYNAGFRIMGLTHFFDNELGGSSAGLNQPGLTKFGRQVITKMNETDIIIDLAHASPALISDVLSASTKPVLVSHTGIRTIHDSPRNLTDEQIKAITNKGGIIGIGFWNGAIGSTSPRAIANTMRYVTDLVGYEHVSLGSDWDGGTTTYFDAANIWVLTKALMDEGFSEKEIKGIMGGNQIDFLLQYLPKE